MSDHILSAGTPALLCFWPRDPSLTDISSDPMDTVLPAVLATLGVDGVKRNTRVQDMREAGIMAHPVIWIGQQMCPTIDGNPCQIPPYPVRFNRLWKALGDPHRAAADHRRNCRIRA